MDVVAGRSAQSPTATQQAGVHPQGAERPHLAVGAPFGAEQGVQRAVDIGHYVERQVEMGPVGGEPFGRGKGDDSDASITELGEAIAHGDHVLLARQSSEMAVEHQHQRTTLLVGRSPRPTGVVDEFQIGGQWVAGAKRSLLGHGHLHRRAYGEATDRVGRGRQVALIDQRLREAKDRAIEPVARRLVAMRVPAGWLTAAGLVASVVSGVLAWRGLSWWALAVFVLGRVLDGLDGAVARRADTASDLGGYLDQLADTVGYAAVPLGLAAGAGSAEAWAACAVLVASFYVNIVSWAYLAALAEKRGAGAAAQGVSTSIVMPTGLVEGAETIVLYGLMLAVPGWFVGWAWSMAVLVALTVVQRVAWAVRHLR